MANLAIQIPFLILGALSVKPRVQSLIPPTPAERITNVRIGAGSNSQQDGNVPGIHLYDFSGLSIGWTRPDGKHIDKGVGHDISVPHIDLENNAAAQAEYIAISQGGNDALCISYVTVTTPDGVQYGWNGDTGFLCGAAWAYGNTTASADPDGGIFQPRCVWIDGDATNGIKQGMGIHLPSFIANAGRVDQYNHNNDLMCKAEPRFSMYDTLGFLDMIPAFTKGMFDQLTLLDFDPAQTLDPGNWLTQPLGQTPEGGIFRRQDDRLPSDSTEAGGMHAPKIGTPANTQGGGYSKNGTETSQPRKQSDKHRTELIITKSPNHSAKELCNSKTSWSPDLVSLVEGLFCDMETRTLWPLCSPTQKDDCFSIADEGMRSPQSTAAKKIYKTVHEW